MTTKRQAPTQNLGVLSLRATACTTRHVARPVSYPIVARSAHSQWMQLHTVGDHMTHTRTHVRVRTRTHVAAIVAALIALLRKAPAPSTPSVTMAGHLGSRHRIGAFKEVLSLSDKRRPCLGQRQAHTHPPTSTASANGFLAQVRRHHVFGAAAHTQWLCKRYTCPHFRS